MEEIIINVYRCQRCGNSHINLKFVLLANAVDEWCYWVMCPDVNQPILMKVTKDVDIS